MFLRLFELSPGHSTRRWCQLLHDDRRDIRDEMRLQLVTNTRPVSCSGVSCRTNDRAKSVPLSSCVIPYRRSRLKKSRMEPSFQSATFAWYHRESVRRPTTIARHHSEIRPSDRGDGERRSSGGGRRKVVIGDPWSAWLRGLPQQRVINSPYEVILDDWRVIQK
jgi:hypothetical protein